MTLSKDKIIYGIDTYMKPQDNNQLNNLLKIPFQEQRSPENN
jgi:hypothetical protein